MLRLSKMADYGTVVLTAMIGEPERSRSAAEIAAAIHVPVPTVSKILKILGRGGLVASLRGARGGYLLARPAAEITLADIIHAMDGPIGMTECSVTPGLCTQEAACAVRANWQRINRAVLGVLREITLDQMIAPVPQPVDASALTRKRTSATNRTQETTS
ncbi:SUF system Fe-S cluster assembly regulator [Noviherbaspirillum autotrophicum]|uniref:Rrf2 family transcriptional regulator n=1 Tax=Noviherbaspirillum autotrophicum TaxID=709839 RepID=A0A0C1YRD9_9BURK|nr:SUF system Fe-S cluster assembly regulator [Noviherbaspirillum autotrophicum]KIF83222.1 Rrf2 family transcriptional regulator [Noviherbaspirillum autotrophicum]